MKSPFAFTLSLLLFSSFPTQSQTKIDSIRKVLKSAVDTTRVKAMTDLAAELIYTNPNESEELAKQAIDISKKLKYYQGTSKAYYVLCVSYDIRGDYLQAAESAQSGISLIQSHEHLDVRKEIFGSLLNGLGLAYYHQSRYNDALTSFFSALKIFSDSNNIPRLANLNNNIGLVYHDLQDLDKALVYYSRSFEYAINLKSITQAGRSSNNIGLIYTQKKEFSSAIKYYLLSLDYKSKTNDQNGISAVYLNLGVTYKQLKDYKRAIYYLNLSEEIKTKLDDQLGLLNVQDSKADILIRQKRFEEAKIITLKNLKLLKQLNTTEPKTTVFNRFYDLYESQGKYKEALAWYIRNAQLKDSLFTAEKHNQALEIETKYETEKKEQTIKLLESEKRTQRVWRYLLLGAVLMVCIIYFLQRSRANKTKALLLIQRDYSNKLKETDLLKTRFFSNISHEFRTPLTLIIAPIEDKLKSTSLSGEDRHDLQIVKRNANRLLELVNQLMDLSKLEANKMELQLQFGNLETFLKVLVTSFKSFANQKQIHFIQHIQFRNIEIKFDADKIEKIVTNLLMNAFKFTQPGGTVTITANDFLHPEKFSIIISDTGIGISEEDQIHLFSPFHQVSEPNDGDLGTGLGLSLVKELIKLHNGSIDLSSVVSRGTTITVLLPILPHSEKKPVVQAMPSDPTSKKEEKVQAANSVLTDPQQSKKRINKQTLLIVENDLDFRGYITSIFRPYYNVLEASDGEEGFCIANEHIPDLIISDMHMPKLSGVGLSEKLKNNERTSHLPIIILSGKSDLDSQLEGLKAGIDGYITKPFSVDELLLRVSNSLSHRQIIADKYMNSHLNSYQSATMVEISEDPQFLKNAKAIIAEHISDSQFGVEQMAEKMKLSRAQLFRKLKAITGLSPNELINDIRLLKAAELISLKVNNVSQICFMVGFNDQSYFSKRFRKRFGKSPTEFSLESKKK